MKKFFIALSVLAALALSVVPSQALVGMPDDVPGSDIMQAFFVVEVAGGLDSLVVFQEVGGIGGTAAVPTGRLHWIIRDRKSNHLKDQTRSYSPFDVDAVSVRDLLDGYCTAADKLALLTTLGGVDCYVGYIEWQNNSTTLTKWFDAVKGYNVVDYTANNMIAKLYLVDTARGKTSGVNLAAKEALSGVPANQPWEAPFVDPAGAIRSGTTTWAYNWLAVQYQASTAGANDGEFVALAAPPIASGSYEAYSAQALAASQQRESSAQGVVVGPVGTQVAYVVPSSFLLAPRFYLHDALAENFIFLWKSANVTAPATGRVPCTVYNTVEYGVSTYINLPNELNIFDCSVDLPPYFLTTFPSAGWLRIPFNDADTGAGVFAPTGWAALDWLGYSWQYASNASSTLNWAALFQVARDVDWAGK